MNEIERFVRFAELTNQISQLRNELAVQKNKRKRELLLRLEKERDELK